MMLEGTNDEVLAGVADRFGALFVVRVEEMGLFHVVALLNDGGQVRAHMFRCN